MYNIALKYLKQMFGEDASFRPDQYEAIEKVLTDRRLLVVEKTGWGKSIVYFIATKILRDRGMGPTILISPLLSLMRNQIDNANRLGLQALTINSGTIKDRESILLSLKEDNCDLLLISPERLANKEDMSAIINNIQKGIGLFVVDEAHCISDWGHDFRPDYRRIVSMVKSMPPNVPILATTATANQRVVDDIVEQLGNIEVLRGPLMRESLAIQVIKLRDQSQRLAWLAKTIPLIEGNGIVYCLTKRDTEKVSEWLQLNGINAKSYTSETENRSEIEEAFMQNKIKCLVATVALGMGYDKPDIGFVIHYQRPGNIVSYYQQIGRAGRQIENAYAILLSGAEDDDIQDYFINHAFPTDNEMINVVEALENADGGLKRKDLLQVLNITDGRLSNCLKYLTVENIIENEKNTYYRTIIPWHADLDRSRRITKRRYEELQEMRDYVDYNGCYMEYLATRLDDDNYSICGKCTNCLGQKYFSDEVPDEATNLAQQYLRQQHSKIEQRKRYPNMKAIPKELLIEEGYTLCDYGDAGWGKYVLVDKYKTGFVRDEIIQASAELISNWLGEELNEISITYIPSNRQPTFVRDFADKLASLLNVSCVETLEKTATGVHQKELHNSAFQFDNAEKGFRCTKSISGKLVLIDDFVDSRWTLTVCGQKLLKAGADCIYPFAIASTAEQKGKLDGNQ